CRRALASKKPCSAATGASPGKTAMDREDDLGCGSCARNAASFPYFLFLHLEPAPTSRCPGADLPLCLAPTLRIGRRLLVAVLIDREHATSRDVSGLTARRRRHRAIAVAVAVRLQPQGVVAVLGGAADTEPSGRAQCQLTVGRIAIVLKKELLLRGLYTQ